MQSQNLTTVIGTNACGYRQVSFDRLGENIGKHGLTRIEGYVNAGITVSVDQHPAFADEYRAVLGTVSKRSAAGTSFAGMVWVYFDGFNFLLSTDASECHSESAIGHTFYPAVALSGESAVFQSLQIFNRYGTVVSFGEVNDLMSNLVVTGIIEMRFLGAEFLQQTNRLATTFIGVGFESRPSDRDVALAIPDIPAEIELLENLVLWCHNRYGSKRSRPDIDTENVLASFNIEIFAEHNGYSPMVNVIRESEIGSCITIGNKFIVSFISTVFGDRNGEPAIEGSHRNNGVAVLGMSELPTARYVKTDGNRTYRITIALEAGHDVLNDVNDELRLKPIVGFDGSINNLLDTVTGKPIIGLREFVPILANLENNLGCFGVFLDKESEFGILLCSQREDVEFQSPDNFDHVFQNYMVLRVYKGSEGVGETEKPADFPLRTRSAEPPIGNKKRK